MLKVKVLLQLMPKFLFIVKFKKLGFSAPLSVFVVWLSNSAARVD